MMFVVQSIPICLPSEYKQVKTFLETFHLSYTTDIDYCAGIYEEQGTRLIATASLQGDIIRNIAIHPDYQGQGLVAILVSHLLGYGASQGLFHYFLYTKPEKLDQFTDLGFTLLAAAKPYAALLEYGPGGLSDWLDTTGNSLPGRDYAALVMNCNPITLGHRCLVEAAACKHASVVAFIVEEDCSLIPFRDRLALARENLADLANVTVLPGGPYMISRATFPAYFLKKEDALTAQTRLDATLFAEKIAPALSITDRYVGEEPLDPTTAVYNRALADILPAQGVQLHILPRRKNGPAYISATEVRLAWQRRDWAALAQLVSPVTLAYLKGTIPSC